MWLRSIFRFHHFLVVVSSLVNTVGASAKRSDILQYKQADLIAQAIKNGEIASGRGLHVN